MQSIGIDLSAEPKGTAIATVTWFEDYAEVTSLQTGADDALVLHYLHHPDGTVGIDCPLGWPAPFVQLLAEHTNGSYQAAENRASGWRRQYIMRTTDLFVRQMTGIVPLSVAADRIGHTAIRLAAIMSEVGQHVNTVRDGSGDIIEVYPAASLRVWGLGSGGYKGPKNLAHLTEQVDGLQRLAPWLHLSHVEELCRTSDDAFDAVVCALTARAAKTGNTIPPQDVDLARREGWIHLPESRLPSAPWCQDQPLR